MPRDLNYNIYLQMRSEGFDDDVIGEMLRDDPVYSQMLDEGFTPDVIFSVEHERTTDGIQKAADAIAKKNASLIQLRNAPRGAALSENFGVPGKVIGGVVSAAGVLQAGPQALIEGALGWNLKEKAANARDELIYDRGKEDEVVAIESQFDAQAGKAIRNSGLSDQKKALQQAETLADVQMGAKKADVVNGDLHVTPGIVWDREATTKAVEDADATPLQKEQFNRIYPRLRDLNAEGEMEIFGTLSEFKEFQKTMPNATPADQIERYKKENDGWFDRIPEQLKIALTKTRASTAAQVQGIIAAATKDTTWMEAALESEKETQKLSQQASAVGGKPIVGEVAAGALSVMPSMGAGFVASTIARAAGATAATQASIGFGGAIGGAMLQTFGSVFTSATDKQKQAYLSRGMSDQEATDKAMNASYAPATLSALVTGIVTAMGGRRGVEAIWKPGVREEMKKGFTGFVSKFATGFKSGAKQEAAEEWWDQFWQGIIERETFNPEKDPKDIIIESMIAAGIGGVIGGSVEGGVKGFTRSNAAEHVETLEANNAPETANEIRKQVAKGAFTVTSDEKGNVTGVFTEFDDETTTQDLLALASEIQSGKDVPGLTIPAEYRDNAVNEIKDEIKRRMQALEPTTQQPEPVAPETVAQPVAGEPTQQQPEQPTIQPTQSEGGEVTNETNDETITQGNGPQQQPAQVQEPESVTGIDIGQVRKEPGSEVRGTGQPAEAGGAVTIPETQGGPTVTSPDISIAGEAGSTPAPATSEKQQAEPKTAEPTKLPEPTASEMRQHSDRIESIVDDAVQSGGDRVRAENEAWRVVTSAINAGKPIDWGMVKRQTISRALRKKTESTTLDEPMSESSETTRIENEPAPVEDREQLREEEKDVILSKAKLTANQRKAVDSLRAGKSVKEIAQEMGVSVSMVRTHLRNTAKALSKIGVKKSIAPKSQKTTIKSPKGEPSKSRTTVYYSTSGERVSFEEAMDIVRAFEEDPETVEAWPNDVIEAYTKEVSEAEASVGSDEQLSDEEYQDIKDKHSGIARKRVESLKEKLAEKGMYWDGKEFQDAREADDILYSPGKKNEPGVSVEDMQEELARLLFNEIINPVLRHVGLDPKDVTSRDLGENAEEARVEFGEKNEPTIVYNARMLGSLVQQWIKTQNPKILQRVMAVIGHESSHVILLRMRKHDSASYDALIDLAWSLTTEQRKAELKQWLEGTGREEIIEYLGGDEKVVAEMYKDDMPDDMVLKELAAGEWLAERGSEIISGQIEPESITSPEARSAVQQVVALVTQILERIKAVLSKLRKSGTLDKDQVKTLDQIDKILTDAIETYRGGREDWLTEETTAKYSPAEINEVEESDKLVMSKFSKRLKEDERFDEDVRETIYGMYEPMPTKLQIAMAKEQINARGDEAVEKDIFRPSAKIAPSVRVVISKVLLERMNARYIKAKESGEPKHKLESMLEDLGEFSEKVRQVFATEPGRQVQIHNVFNQLIGDGIVHDYKKTHLKARDRHNKRNKKEVDAIVEVASDAGGASRKSKANEEKLDKIEREANRIARVLSDTPNFAGKTQQDEAIALIRKQLSEEQGDFVERLVELGASQITAEQIEAMATENRRRIDLAAKVKETFHNQKLAESLSRKLSVALSDTLSWTDKKIDKLTQLVREHSVKGVDGFKEQMREFGVDEVTTNQIDAMAAENRRRIKNVEREQAVNQLMRKYGRKGVGKRIDKKTWERIVEAAQLGLLTNKEFYEIAADRLGLPKYDPAVAARLQDMAAEIAKLDEGTEKSRRIRNMLGEIMRLKGVHISDILSGLAYAHMLSGYNTSIDNTMDTALHVMMNEFVDSIMGRGTTDKKKVILRGLKKGAVEAKHILKTGERISLIQMDERAPAPLEIIKFGEKGGVPINPGTAIEDAVKAILETKPFKLLNAHKFIGRFLEAQDAINMAVSKEMAMYREAYSQAKDEGLTGKELAERANELLNNSDEAYQDALNVAKERKYEGTDIVFEAINIVEQGVQPEVFTRSMERAAADIYRNRMVGTVGYAADKMLQVFRGIENPFWRNASRTIGSPFVVTVANVLNKFLDWSPWGYVRATIPKGHILQNEKYARNLTPRQRQILSVKASSSFIVAGMVMAAVKAGLSDITGSGPEDKEEKRQWLASRNKPYSIRFGNGPWISYKYLPWGFMLTIIGQYEDMRKRGKGETALDRATLAVVTAPALVLDQSFLKGPTSFIKMFDDMKTRGFGAIKNVARNTASMAFPNMLRDVERLFDPSRKNDTDIRATMISAIPFAQMTLGKQYSILGEQINFFRQRLFSIPDPSPAAIVLAEVGVYPYQDTPRGAYLVKDGERVPMNPQQYEEFVRGVGGDFSKWLVDDFKKTGDKAVDKKSVEDTFKSLRDDWRKGLSKKYYN